MKAVLISIKPKWCELIASGKKTVEVRKTRPKLETPFKCYIYRTLPKYGDWNDKDGKVIGEFVCEKITYLGNVATDPWKYLLGDIHEENKRLITDEACLSEKEILQYKGRYAWHISDLVIYDKPQELSELIPNCQYGQDGECTGASEFYCPFQKRDYNPDGSINLVECGKKITRPPQSWCYVEELKGENHV